MRKILYIFLGLIVLLVVIAAVLPFIIDANTFKPQIEAAAEKSLGRKLTLGNIKLSIFSGGVAVDNISISEDPEFGMNPFLTAKSLAVGVEMMPLILHREVNVRDVTIQQPQVTLLHNASGKWNFSTLGSNPAANTPTQSQPSPAPAPAPSAAPSSGGTPPSVSVQKIAIKDGKLLVGEAGESKRHEYDHVDLNASNLSYTSQFPFDFSATAPGNGTIKLNGKAGPLNQSDASATPLQANLDVHSLDLNSTGFIEPASGISGVLDFAGTVTSDGQRATSKGKITAAKLKLVPAGAPAGQPVQVDYDVDYNLKPQTGSLKQGDVHIGKAVAHLTGTFNNSGKVAALAMKLNGSNMPAADLESVLPAVGVNLPSGASLKEGTMSVDLNIAGPVDKLVTTGPAHLDNAKLAGFDLGAKMGALASFAGIQKGSDTVIQTFASDLRVAPEGIRTDNLNVVVPSIGSITGAGTIAANQALDFKMMAHLNASNNSVGKIVGQISNISGGQNGAIPFKVQGTSSQPQFVPDVGAITGNLAKGAAAGQIPTTPQDLQNLGTKLGGLFGKKKQ
jgi:AsmA protein